MFCMLDDFFMVEGGEADPLAAITLLAWDCILLEIFTGSLLGEERGDRSSLKINISKNL